MSKFGDDLRRIVRYQELLDLINGENGTADQTEKGAIDGARGIAYGNGSTVNGSTTGTPGVTKPDGGGIKPNPIVDVGTTDGESSATDAAKDVLDNDKIENTDDLSDPDNSLRDGWYDLESLLDGAVDALGKYPPAPNSNIAINALTGLTDSAATRALVIHLKEAANAFIAPSDRESSNQRVDEDGFEQGIYYQCTTGLSIQYSSSLSGIKEAAQNDTNAAGSTSPYAPWTFDSWRSASNPAITVDPPSSANIGVTRYMHLTPAIPGSGITILLPTAALSCFSSPPTDPYVCTITGQAVLWADLGATQLAFQTSQSSATAPFSSGKEGLFVPHPYDDNIPPEFVDGVSIIDAKTTDGDDVRIGPLHYGGWYAHYSTAGVPTGDATANSVLIINANRTHGGFVTPNQLLRMLPPA
jgi:hypothetical protein